LYPVFGYAGGLCSDLLHVTTHRLEHPLVDTSVELELNTSPEVFRLFTTEDGKVEGLLGKEEVPDWFSQWVQEHYSDKVNPREVAWDSIPYPIQLKLLQSVSQGRDQKFFEDRRFHGLVAVKEIDVQFSKATWFQGKMYPPGKHRIDLKNQLRSLVEYGSPESQSLVDEFEFHFRSARTAGEVSTDAWALLDGIGVPRPHQHVHIVAPLPFEALLQKPIVEAARMGDFFRRANLASEMITILESGMEIGLVRNSEYISFAPLSGGALRLATQYFLDVAQGQSPIIGDKLKMAWVGFRGSDKYDQPGLWGLEVRGIPSNSDPTTIQHFLDAIQYDMNQEDYGISQDRMSRWIKKYDVKWNVPQMIAATWYNRSWEVLFKNAPAEIRSRINVFRKWRLPQRYQDNDEVKMLLFDWSRDPLFFDKPDQIERIQRAQVQAWKQLMKNPQNRYAILKNFLLESGLYRTVMSSIGISVKN